MIDPGEVKQKIESELEDAQVKVADLSEEHAEDGHFRVVVVSPEFQGKPTVKQHQRVYNAVSKDLQGEDAPIHALGLQTYTPDEWNQMVEEHSK